MIQALHFVLTCLVASVRSLLTPKILLLSLLPFILTTVSFIITFVMGGLSVFELASMTAWLPQWVVSTFSFLLNFVFSIFILLIFYWLWTAILSVFLLPAILKELVKNEYPHVSLDQRGQGFSGIMQSLKHSLKLTLLYVLAFALTFPIFFIPVIGFIVPIIITGYFNYRLILYELLSEVKSNEKPEALIKKYKKQGWLAGSLSALVGVIPFLAPFVPVISILVFCHLYLKRQGAESL